MENRIALVKNIFNKKNIVQKINCMELLSKEIVQPNYPEGQVELKIVRYSAEEMFGKNLGNIKIEFIFEDNDGNRLTQMFVLKNGKNNNLAKFIFEVLGYYPDDEFDLKELEGKKILAMIFHYYNANGIGYANIGFSQPA